MNALRVALIAHRLAPSEPTGVARHVRQLANALSAAQRPGDHYVLVSTAEASRSAYGRLETKILPWPRRPVQLGWCLGRGPHLERALGALDVVHLLGPFPPAPSRAPIVVSIHDLMPLLHPEWFPTLERWSFARSVKLAARRATRVIVHSRFVAESVVDVLGIDPSRIAIVPHGITGIFAKRLPAGAGDTIARRHNVEPGRYAVYVGAVSTRKNLLPVVEAMNELRQPLPLLIIGASGRGGGAVDKKIATLPSGPARRTGYLPDDETAALVARAAVLVHPALEEGFGLTPLEAMAAGTPVIAARVGAIPEVVGNAAELIENPTDAAEWAAAMDRVLHDTSLRENLVSRGRAIAATHTWDRAATMTMAVHRLAAEDHAS